MLDVLNIPYRYGGSDRSGCDCWGLICLIYRDYLTIELPNPAILRSLYTHDRLPLRAIGGIIAADFTEVNELTNYAILLLTKRDNNNSTGFVLYHRGDIYATTQECGSYAVSYQKWIASGVEIGGYRSYRYGRDR